MSVDLRRALASISPPDEAGAERRAWTVVRSAFAQREPVAGRRRYVKPVIALAAVGAIVAAVVSPPGRAVLDEIRDAVAPTRVERASPALFSLPAPGRLLVDSTAGVWVVQQDGSKRLLPGYREASWSPHGLFVVGAEANRLAALEPDGGVRWTLSRPRVRFPRWGGTLTDTRIAYFSGPPAGRALRVVAGDGTGDHPVTTGLRDVAPAWQPGSTHVLAVAHDDGRIRLWSDGATRLATSAPGLEPLALDWSADGKRLFVLERHRLRILGPDLRPIAERPMPARWTATALAARPDGTAVAVARRRAGESEVVVFDRGHERRAFAGTGAFSGIDWSPDGSRLLVELRDADQWVFVRWDRAGRIDAVSNVAAEFDSDRFPAVAGWCCSR